MPKKEINDYTFYKIVCLDKDLDLCYVGSTSNWKERQRNHKSNCNNEKRKQYNSKLYQTIRENGGWESFKMIQIGTREQLKLRDAEAIEEEYRQELRTNMNTNRCFTTKEQKQEQLKECIKNYRQNNKERIKESSKEWRDNNKERCKEYCKEWRQNNQEYIKEQNKNYKQENKERIKEWNKNYGSQVITCECGCEITRYSLYNHKKTPKHIKLLNK